MIEGIVGLPGQGKTLFAVRCMMQAAKSGRRVMANFENQFADFALWEEMCEASNALVVIDEAQMWFGARAWQKNTQAELGVFQQHRKEGLDMFWIAQHEARVDAALREITAYVWRVRKFGNFILASRFSLDDKKVCFGRTLFYAPAFYKAYATQTIIGARDGAGYRTGRATAYAGELPDDGIRIISGQKYVRVEDAFSGTVAYRRPNEVELVVPILKVERAEKIQSIEAAKGSG